MNRRSSDHPYSIIWLSSLMTDPPAIAKVGIGAMMAVIVDGYNSFFTQVFSITIMLWMMDMVTGALRAFADDKVRFRWPKVIDGVLRLLIICAIALAVAVVEDAIMHLSGVDIEGKLLSFTYGIIIVAEFTSIISNVSFFYPSLSTLQAKIIEFFPGQRPSVQNTEATVLLTEKQHTDRRKEDKR